MTYNPTAMSQGQTVVIALCVFFTTVDNSQSIDFSVTPLPGICDGEPLLTTFNLTCVVNNASAVLSWVVTGLTTRLGGPIVGDSNLGPFSFPQPTSPGRATLYVRDPNNSQLVIGTCFQCRAGVGIDEADSEKTCLSAIDSPPCPTVELDNTTFTSITFSWTTPGGPPLLSYRIRVCSVGTSECPVQTNCSGCSSYKATDLSPNTSYTITVESFVSPHVDCVRQDCSLITGTTLAAVTVFKCPDIPACKDSVFQECTEIIAGVAVGCLSLSLILTAVSVVFTFFCTRRCYKKKNSPPSPKEYGEARNDVQELETVQLQPSPAYQPFAFT